MKSMEPPCYSDTRFLFFDLYLHLLVRMTMSCAMNRIRFGKTKHRQVKPVEPVLKGNFII